MVLTFQHREFEAEVRAKLNIYERPITDEDALSATDIDLSMIYCFEELETLSHFHNLTSLSVSTRKVPRSFWKNFPKLKELCWICLWGPVDFKCFRHMENLHSLCVSGGDYSGIDYLTWMRCKV